MILALVLFIVILVFAKLYYDRKRQIEDYTLPPDATTLLEANVEFYRQLSPANKILFQERVRDFLAHITITGVDVTVEDLDRLLVGAGAIIPIFEYPDWRYNNITEVLLYPDTFNNEYKTKGSERDVVGMVGEGPMQREMILSQPALRASFQHPGHAQNPAIHEFAHLIDKADGSTDGVPEYLLARPYILPWISIMHKTIADMSSRRGSDISLYGATNDAEFFAVVSEYFFENPHGLQQHHPELFALLERMFHPEQ